MGSSGEAFFKGRRGCCAEKRIEKGGSIKAVLTKPGTRGLGSGTDLRSQDEKIMEEFRLQ